MPGKRWDFASIEDKFKLAQANFDLIQSGGAWVDTTITYSFPSKRFPGTGWYVPDGEGMNYRPFTQSEIKITKQVFEQLEDATGLNFVFDPSGKGELRLGHHNMTVGGYAHYPNGDYSGLLISNDLKISDTGYGLVALIHELGHSLGLKHSHDNPKLAENLDIATATMMSYKNILVRGGSGDVYVNSSHSLMDILALQDMYGLSSKTSHDVYKADGTIRVIADGGGKDTIDLSTWRYDAKDVNIIDLERGFVFYETIGRWATAPYDYETGKTGAWVNRSAGNGFYNMIITEETVIEKLVGSRVSDRMSGDGASQTILGGAGNDTISGRGGDDTLNGGKGRDVLIGGAGADRFVFSGGNDRIKDFDASEGDVLVGAWPM